MHLSNQIITPKWSILNKAHHCWYSLEGRILSNLVNALTVKYCFNLDLFSFYLLTVFISLLRKFIIFKSVLICGITWPFNHYNECFPEIKVFKHYFLKQTKLNVYCKFIHKKKNQIQETLKTNCIWFLTTLPSTHIWFLSSVKIRGIYSWQIDI